MQPFASLLLALLVTAVCSQLPPFLTAPHYYNAEASKHYEALQKQSIQRSPYTFQAAGINAPPYRAHSRPDQFQEILQNPQVSAVYDTESLHSKYKIVCYYESWAISRPGSGSFRVNDYNPLLCTHLIYAFAKIDEPSYTIKSLDEYVDIQSGGYKNATELKLQHPKLKVLIGIGGRNDGGLKFSIMTKNPLLRTQFVTSVLEFVKKHEFDGIEIHWLNPADTGKGGRCEDKENFVKLIKELRTVFSPHGLLISAALTPLKETIDDGYDVPELNANLDFVSILGYNLRSALEPVADHHSPLSRRPQDEGKDVIRNVEFGVRYLLSKGADPEKLILGVPFFGVSFTLSNDKDTELGSPAKGPGLAGNFTGEEGYLAYYEICPLIIQGILDVTRDEYGRVPYASGRGQWVGFEDEQSIEQKMEFIKKLNLGGAMIWAIDLDDSQGVCGTEFPLLRKVYSVLCGEQENVPATSYNEAMKLAPGIQSASLYRVQIPILSSSPLYMQIKVPFSPIHKQPALEVRPALYIADVYNKVCQTNGYHRDPTHCSGFFVCDKGHLRKFTCPFNLKFNEATFTCDWSQYPGCDEPQLSPTPGFQCPGDGLYPNPEKCEAYYICANNEATPMVCTSNTVFNPVNKICDWPRNVICNQRPGPPSPPVLPPPEPPVFPILPQPGPPPIFPILPQPGQPDPVTFPPPFPSTKVTEPLTIPTRRHPFPTTSHRPWTEPTTTRWQPWGGEWTQPTTKGPEFTHRPHVRPPGINDKNKVVCYYTNWSWYRQGIGKFSPEDIDPNLCTHIIYAFTVLDGEKLTIKLHDPWADIDNHLFERVLAIKKRNPEVKVILGLGGWTDSQGDKYSRLVNNPASRRNFVDSTIKFINHHGFDGLDFDWEYPKCWQVDCKRGPESDKPAFAAMLQELRAAFDNNSPRLLLTAAVSPSKTVIDQGYDVPMLARNLDFINVMTYDYHGSWEKKTGHVAPMYYFPGDEFDYFNANFTMNYYLQLGAPREKLIMGMPLYGQSWTLASNSENGLNAPTYGPGERGPYSGQGGMLSYYEICSKLRNDGYTFVRDPHARIGPFAFKGNQWMSFDDAEMIRLKSQFIRDNGFGGGMIWALDFDDFKNVCCQGSYPLMKTINQVLRNYPKEATSEICNEHYSHEGSVETTIPLDKKMCITSRCAQ